MWTNTSAIPLTISSVGASGPYGISATTCSGKIAANSTCSVYVTFTPTALGTQTGTLSVLSTSSANGTLTASLTGVGVADVEASVTSLNFGNVDIGFSSTPQTITITNYTAAAIALTSISINGDYADTTTCGGTIAGLSTCTITITFTPTAVGTRTGTLTVNTNDTKYPVISIPLTGNGVDFSITVTPTSASTIAGYSLTFNATLTPLGGYSGPIALTCTTTAGGSTCIPQSSSITVTAVNVVPVAVTTTSQYTVIGYSGIGLVRGSWLALLSLLSGTIFLLKRRRLIIRPRLLAGFAALVLLGGAGLGCGSRNPDANPSPTYAGTYTYTVSATDGTLTHTAAYSLTVTIRQ